MKFRCSSWMLETELSPLLKFRYAVSDSRPRCVSRVVDLNASTGATRPRPAATVGAQRQPLTGMLRRHSIYVMNSFFSCISKDSTMLRYVLDERKVNVSRTSLSYSPAAPASRQAQRCDRPFSARHHRAQELDRVRAQARCDCAQPPRQPVVSWTALRDLTYSSLAAHSSCSLPFIASCNSIAFAKRYRRKVRERSTAASPRCRVSASPLRLLYDVSGAVPRVLPLP